MAQGLPYRECLFSLTVSRIPKFPQVEAQDHEENLRLGEALGTIPGPAWEGPLRLCDEDYPWVVGCSRRRVGAGNAG